MQQIAVRAMDLDTVEAEPRGAAGRPHEVLAHTVQSRSVERDRNVLAVRMRHGRGGHGFPARRLIRRNLRAAFPRRSARRLAAGVAQLDGDGHGRMRSDRRQHPGQRGLVRIGVQAEVLGRDPPLRRNRRGLQDHEARAREGEVAQVDHVPVRRLAVLGRVLAHGRDDDPIREAKIANQQRLEQTTHY